MARDVAGTGFVGTYVDANAISPARMLAIETIMTAAGASVVDGAVFGPPPWHQGTSRIYLAGETAPYVAELFSEGPVTPVPFDGPTGSALALKMSYGATQKGVIALRALSMAMADRHGVGDLLATEWDRGDAGATADARHRVAVAAPKAWRWIAEMQEMADTAANAGLPDGFHRAAAEVFAQWRGHKDSQGRREAVADDVDAVFRELGRDRCVGGSEPNVPGAAAPTTGTAEPGGRTS